ncbi:hypothetical protein GSI_03614 [Ganoderma sinense ZZ0214-1]|uniref:BTB domain-containing protein n=1 Tax=Ganoderma sinense ZZ0214-1 TaxID=1077348 RepID=A0A2G8SK27_9APHY|nr:hypothetical protein GSI_03614 [Ganoderma sinense ZZ0214-1]
MESRLQESGYPRIVTESDSRSRFVVNNSSDNPAVGGDSKSPKLMLISSDRTFYYVQHSQILAVTNNAFAGLLLDNASSITLPEPSSVLDLLIHLVYDISCIRLAPSLATSEATLNALIKYGILPRLHAVPGKPLYELLLFHAPHHPIAAYALAAHYGLEDAAVAISEHLLAYDVSRLSDALVVQMGPVYFRRLLVMHQARLSALKGIVLRPPGQHPPMPTCGGGGPAAGASELGEAWAFAVAQLVWDASPGKPDCLCPGIRIRAYLTYTLAAPSHMFVSAPAGMSTDALRRAFESAGAACGRCEACRAALQRRIGEVCDAWAAVKRTI